jgi:hypothetical protein
LRTILSALFTAALLAVPGLAKAAPRNIDECEKIQAADAYNLCLASFGPVARGFHRFADGADGTKEIETASRASSKAEVTAASQSWHHHRQAFRHGSARHHWARHSVEHKTRAALHRSKHGNSQKMAFSLVSSRTRLR